VTPLQRLVAALTDAIARTGPAAPLILFGASFIEYVFPPFPGDLVVVLGAWYAVEGQLSWSMTFVATTAGALAGAWVDWRVGAALGRRLEGRAHRPTVVHRLLTEERLAQFEASYRRYGPLLLAANRFFPGIRAFVFVAAGASGIPLRTVLLLGGVSAALWNALLLGAGALVAKNADELVALFDRYTRLATTVLAGAAVVLAAAWLLRRRAARRRAGAP
jgi:membrane protein DedA with SNARE-associated domain